MCRDAAPIEQTGSGKQKSPAAHGTVATRGGGHITQPGDHRRIGWPIGDIRATRDKQSVNLFVVPRTHDSIGINRTPEELRIGTASVPTTSGR